MTNPATAEPRNLRRELPDIQGNLIGFNKDHQRLLFLNFADQGSGRAFLAAMTPMLTTGKEVLAFNALYKEISGRLGHRADGIVESTWTNLLISQPGLALLAAPQLDAFPAEFVTGMAGRAAEIGDADASGPANWVTPFANGARVHACAIVAADSPEDLDAGCGRVQALMDQHGVALAGQQDGNVREGNDRGHEHFGFKDGISQPGIAGLTRSSKHGQDVIATGEFLIGYPDQDGNISGQPRPLPNPGQPGYNPIAPPPPPAPLPPWARNGSFVVYRRLRQDVAAFLAFLTQQSTPLSLPAGAVGAKLVGRWASGAPLERVRGERTDRDPAEADPGAVGTTSLLQDDQINNFVYDPRDADGHLVPRGAHIRKTNPRNETPPGKEEANRHRILRRGIPYGTDFVASEQPYGGGVPPSDGQDRGLIFICYQASITRGFEFIQQQWANAVDFPQVGDGQDAIISQVASGGQAPGRFLSIPPHGQLATQPWVFTTGGDYFFAPSISGLLTLSADSG